MEDLDCLIATIYEAGAIPELWGDMLTKASRYAGAVGANLITSSAYGLSITSSPEIAQVTRDFEEAGWNKQNSRVDRLLAQARYPGFLTDADLHTGEELISLPMYKDFLIPRNAAAGAATVIMGADQEGIVLAFEAFADHPSSQRALPLLDRLRPHFARAAVLSRKVQDQHTASLLEAFNAMATPVGLLDCKGKLIGASEAFEAFLDDLLIDRTFRLGSKDAKADSQLVQILEASPSLQEGASIALRNEKGEGAAILHLIPAQRQARDLFSKIAYFAMIASPNNTSLPSTDILSALFDLTPTEARVARSVAMGSTSPALTHEFGVSQETIKSHLKRIFLKTGTNRQIDLAILISGLK